MCRAVVRWCLCVWCLLSDPSPWLGFGRGSYLRCSLQSETSILEHSKSWSGMLDLVTIVPSVVVFSITVRSSTKAIGSSPGLKAVRLLRILRILRIQQAFHLLDSAVFREGAKLLLTILSSVFVWAGVFQVRGGREWER